MPHISIEYRFAMADGRAMRFPVCLDPECLELVCQTQEVLPEWTLLEVNRCPNCPMDSATTLHCPLAVALLHLVTSFDGIASFDETDLVVITKERTISQHTTVQRAVSSIMGLLMATSGCPNTAYFRPMAVYHLPLANPQETTYRAASMYLLGQYFRKQQGLPADLELNGLKKIYAALETTNVAIAQRLRAASETDSSVNAVVILDLYAKLLPMAIDTSLEQLRPLFTPFLDT